jgi:hypothetical protein
VSSCNSKKVFFFQESFCPSPFFLVWFGFFFLWRGGCCSGFYFLGVLGVEFYFVFGMVFSLCPSSVRDTPCPHCFSLYTLSGLLRHVKSAHTPASLISQASQVVLFLQVSSPLVLLLGSIPFISWGWFWV